MTLKIEKYTRKPFPVEAVQVTEDNLSEVAQWCGGDIHTSTKTLRDDQGVETGKIKLQFVKVDVHRPLNDRHTKAFVGDWVLKSESGFKVYALKAFENSFQKKAEPAGDTVGGLSTDADAVAAAGEPSDGRERLPEPTETYTFKDSLGQMGLSVPEAEEMQKLVEEYIEAGMSKDDAVALVVHGAQAR